MIRLWNKTKQRTGNCVSNTKSMQTPENKLEPRVYELSQTPGMVIHRLPALIMNQACFWSLLKRINRWLEKLTSWGTGIVSWTSDMHGMQRMQRTISSSGGGEALVTEEYTTLRYITKKNRRINICNAEKLASWGTKVVYPNPKLWNAKNVKSVTNHSILRRGWRN